jgi:hypothetical protein
VRWHGPGLPAGLTAQTLAEKPDLESPIRALPDTFPEFMHHDAAVNRYWSGLFTDFAGSQIAVCDDEVGIVAAGHCIPVFWDETIEGLPAGLDGVLGRGMEDLDRGRPDRSFSPPGARTASPQGARPERRDPHRDEERRAEHGLRALIAPVRPMLKDRYPLTPLERYVRWERDGGLPFDPWLRVHRRLGGPFLRVATRSVVITGTISEWEEWTGMRFPESDAYFVPGALQPVVMDLGWDLGSYEEPNVWMRHPVTAEG